jgi:poly(A) polymerase
MESRLRLLILKLEYLNGIKAAHPFVKSIDTIITSELPNKYISSFYIGLSLDTKSTTSTDRPKLDLSQAVTEFVESVINWEKKTNTMDIHVKHLKR